MRDGYKRWTLYIPEKIFWGVKKASEMSCCSATAWLIRSLFDRFQKEGIELSAADVKRFNVKHQKRVRAGNAAQEAARAKKRLNQIDGM